MDDCIEDFDLEPAEYRVLAQAWDLENNEIEETLVLAVDKDPEEAIRLAKLKAAGFRTLIETGATKWGETEVSLVVVSVETVIRVEDEEQYVGCLFMEGIPVDSGKK